MQNHSWLAQALTSGSEQCNQGTMTAYFIIFVLFGFGLTAQNDTNAVVKGSRDACKKCEQTHARAEHLLDTSPADGENRTECHIQYTYKAA